MSRHIPDQLQALSDEELMKALGVGEMSALAVLVERHQQGARGLAFRVLGRWDVADDIAQDAFLRVYRVAGRYEPTAAFATWLHRIVVNLCLDWLKRRRVKPLPTAGIELEGPGRPGDGLDREEKQRAVQEAVAALPERQRIVLVLHRFEGKSHTEIAQLTGWSESAVESLLVRAYSRLREQLKRWVQQD